MKFRDAVEQSIRSFYNGQLPKKAIEASEKEFIYTPDYFDRLLEDDEEVADAAPEPAERA